jgi:hypothetical protein
MAQSSAARFGPSDPIDFPVSHATYSSLAPLLFYPLPARGHVSSPISVTTTHSLPAGADHGAHT